MVNAKTLMRPLLLAAVLLGFSAGLASATSVKVDAAKCETQLEQFARTEMDCSVSAQLDEATLDDVPETIQGLISGLACTLPISAPKSDVYGKWIHAEKVALPQTTLTCGSPKVDLRFDLVFDIRCRKTQDDWQCPKPVTSVERIGVLGTVLANYLNRADVLPQAFERLLREHDG